MTAEGEIWQVSIDDEVYESSYETLVEWIRGGRVLPTDKVRKGNRNWIPANRAPMLRDLFTAGAGTPVTASPVEPVPPVMSGPQSGIYEIPRQSDPEASEPPTHAYSLPTNPVCHYHPQIQASLLCRICGTFFCGSCPKFVGSSKIPLCPLCGDLCIPYDMIVEKLESRSHREKGFGWEDLRNAITFPFQNIIGFLIISTAFAFLQLAGGFGGYRGGFLLLALSYGIFYGCLTQVIKQMAWGRFDRGFMPDFSSFHLWDNGIHPTLIGVGVSLVTIGPIIILVLALFTGLLGQAKPAPFSTEAKIEEIKKDQFTQEDMSALINSESPEKDQEAMRKLNKLHPASQFDTMVKEQTPDTEHASMVQLSSYILQHSVLIVILIIIFLLWALFYYPMALAVAGYTESFWSVINPLVGIDTIRRMGMSYIKVFMMYLVILIVEIVVLAMAYVITSPFKLPFMGNLPYQFINGIINIYGGLVIAYILGKALYHNADVLNIPAG